MPNPSRQALILTLLALLVGLPMAPAGLAQEATPVASPMASPLASPVAGAEGVYADPAGRFTVPIPTGWRAETVEDYAVLTSPEGDISATLLVVEGTDPAAAVAQAWQRVEPGFDRQPEQTVEPPPPPGVERLVVLTYDSGQASGEVVQGVGRLVGDRVYVQLYRGELAALARRAAQIQIIDSGFAITGVEQADLSGVEPRPLTPELLAELEGYIADTLARLEVPGASVAIVQDGQIVYEQGFGVRELGGSAPVGPETRMMIGSTTKSMTTLLMATLVDDGRLRWDTPVVDLLPTFAVADPELTQRLTVRNLVCACTGVPRRDLEFIFNAEQFSAEDVVASLAGFEFFTGFGEAFQYSNQMVATGGYAAAVAAGGREGSLYDDYVGAMQARVLDPIGMPSSTFSFAAVEASPDHATPHGATLEATYEPIPLEAEEFVTPVAPAGALWSTAGDMARYAITELNRGVGPDGNRVVSAENLEETWQPQVPVSAETSYGLGWFIDDWKGRRLIHHGGNTFGFTSDLAFMPDAGIGVVVLTNGQATNLFNEAVRYRVLELAFDQEPEFDRQVAFFVEQGEQALAGLQGQLGEAVDPEAVRPFVGRYRHAVLGSAELTLRDGSGGGTEPVLSLDVGEFSTALLPTTAPGPEGDRYLTVDPPLVGLLTILRQVDGVPNVVVVDPASGEEYAFTPDGAATPAAATPAVRLPSVATPVP